jgi:hypothetical protein
LSLLSAECERHDAFLDVRINTGHWANAIVHASLFKRPTTRRVRRRLACFQDPTWWLPVAVVSALHEEDAASLIEDDGSYGDRVSTDVGHAISPSDAMIRRKG